MALTAKNIRRSLLPVVVLSLALFGFVWVCWLEIQSSRSGYTMSGGPAFLYHQDMAFLLVLGAIGLILNKRWAVAVSALFSGIALYAVLFRDFWRISWGGEVPFFSRYHFYLWWINFEGWKIFLSLLAATALCFSIVRLFRPRRA